MSHYRQTPAGDHRITATGSTWPQASSVRLMLPKPWLSLLPLLATATFLSVFPAKGWTSDDPSPSNMIDLLGKMGANVKTGGSATDGAITEIIFQYTHTARPAPGGAMVPPYPITDDLLIQVSKLPLVTHLELNMCPQLTDVGMASLKGMAQLQQLALTGPRVTDVTMGKLAGLTELTFFRASVAGHVTAKGWAVVKNWKKLQSFWVAEGSFGDTEMPYLKELTQLKDITFYGDNVTDAGADVLLGLPNLTSVRLAPPISKTEEAKLKAALPNCRFWR